MEQTQNKNFSEACEHNWQHLRSSKWTDNSGSYNTKYVRIEYFYCTKCLEEEKLKQEDYSRDTPDWYRD